MSKLPKQQRVEIEEAAKAQNIGTRKAVEMMMGPAAQNDYPLGLTCECDDPNCSIRLEVPLSDRRRIRTKQNRFIIATGHEDLEIERIVEDHKSYLVVEKFMLD